MRPLPKNILFFTAAFNCAIIKSEYLKNYAGGICMAVNFIGLPLLLLLLASVAGIIFGVLKKNKKVLRASLILLAADIVGYLIAFILFE